MRRAHQPIKKAEAAATATATAGKTMAALSAAGAAVPPTSTMLLMPGADVTPDIREEEPEPEATPRLAQLTITYGDRVLAVFDDFPSYRVGELLVLVAERRPDHLPGAGGTTTDIPVRGEEGVAAAVHGEEAGTGSSRAPFASACPAPGPASSSNKEQRRNQQREQDTAGTRGPAGSALVRVLLMPAYSTYMLASTNTELFKVSGGQTVLIKERLWKKLTYPTTNPSIKINFYRRFS